MPTAAGLCICAKALINHITCPTLIQVGTLIPAENSRMMAKLIPHAQLIEYPGYGHGFLEENGVQAAQDILAFLETVDSA
ncbi:MAG: alpha/beta hydrolase [Caldilineaceae bacterium]